MGSRPSKLDVRTREFLKSAQDDDDATIRYVYGSRGLEAAHKLKDAYRREPTARDYVKNFYGDPDEFLRLALAGDDVSILYGHRGVRDAVGVREQQRKALLPW